MASTTSATEQSWSGPSVTHADFAARLAARRAELGAPELPRNTGKRRTVSKLALLKAIEAAGGDW